MSSDYNRLLAENKILRQENKRLRKKFDKKSSNFISQESWQKSIDLIIRFLKVARTTKIETILIEQREKNGNSNK